MRVWQIGQSKPCRDDWARPVVKVEVMYLACIAKLVAHPEMHRDLLDTGDAELQGGPSTWKWSKYNGLIQMKLRRQLREGIDLRQVVGVTLKQLHDTDSSAATMRDALVVDAAAENAPEQ
jgi:hypothetical protein